MISSVHNPKIQEVRQLLRQVKRRREQGAMVVEGVRLAEEAYQSTWEARLVLFSAPLIQRGRTLVEGFAKRGVTVEEVSEGVMNSLSETGTPQGLLVVMTLQTAAFPASPDFLLILDRIRDPGNLGTILRTSMAAGVQAVLLSPDCADVTSPKVLRAGMGAQFHLPMFSLDWSEIRRRLRSMKAMRVFLADSAGGVAYTQADFRSPLALIVGGEADGAGEEAAAMADELVHIPMKGGSESLNAAVAASVLMYEVVRQRAG